MLKIDISSDLSLSLSWAGDLSQKQYYNCSTAVFSLRLEARSMLLAATINLQCYGGGGADLVDSTSLIPRL